MLPLPTHSSSSSFPHQRRNERTLTSKKAEMTAKVWAVQFGTDRTLSNCLFYCISSLLLPQALGELSKFMQDPNARQKDHQKLVRNLRVSLCVHACIYERDLFTFPLLPVAPPTVCTVHLDTWAVGGILEGIQIRGCRCWVCLLTANTPPTVCISGWCVAYCVHHRYT